MKRLIVLGALALTACGNERPRIVKPPAELQSCAAEPAAPNLPERDGTDAVQLERDRLVLAYVLELRSAWGSCFAAVAGIKAWSDAVQ